MLRNIHGLDPELVEELERSGYRSTSEILSTSDVALMNSLNVSVFSAQGILQKISELASPVPQTAYELYAKDSLNWVHTPLPALDACLLGGFGPQITELCGAAGTGKTQCCLSSVVRALVSADANDLAAARVAAAAAPASAAAERGVASAGVGGNFVIRAQTSVVYIDTEATFDPNRVAEIACALYPDTFEMWESGLVSATGGGGGGYDAGLSPFSGGGSVAASASSRKMDLSDREERLGDEASGTRSSGGGRASMSSGGGGASSPLPQASSATAARSAALSATATGTSHIGEASIVSSNSASSASATFANDSLMSGPLGAAPKATTMLPFLPPPPPSPSPLSQKAESLRNLLSRLTVFSVETTPQLISVLAKLEKFVTTNRVRLIILDSVAAFARRELDVLTHRGALMERTALLARLSAVLKVAVETFKIPVIVTNQITTAGGGGGAALARAKTSIGSGGGGGGGGGSSAGDESNYLIPALGVVWGHAVNTRLYLSLGAAGRGYGVVTILKSPVAPRAKFQYRITAAGWIPN